MDENKLDCLLISPPIFYKDSESIWEEVNSNFPPLGLASIAAYLRSKGRSVRIIDCNVECPSVEMFERYFEENIARKFPEVRHIGITSMTPTIKKAYKIAEICKRLYPKSKVTFGGVHATFLTSEVLGNVFVDFVVVGEGEITYEELVSEKPAKNIRGLAFKHDGGMTVNMPRERISDLDALPMPAYDLLPIEKYRPAKGTYRKLPAMSMISSRGCPGRCTFCNKTLGPIITHKKAETIFNEIKYLHEKYGIRQILFYDDTFTVFKDNVVKLCNLLIESRMNIAWTCFARVDYIDEEELRVMKRAGCHQIMYGVENINPIVLQNINKRIDAQKVENAVRWTKKVGIDCRLAFMVGNPGDTREIIEENIRFVNRLNPDLVIINITTPFPGTPMFEWAKERGLLLSYDWDDYNLSKPVMRLETMDENQIRELYHLMYRSFYMRPSYMLRKVLKIRSASDAMVLLEGFKALLGFLSGKNTKHHHS